MADTAPHKYEYDIDLASGSAGAQVIAMVGQGKRVLEIGAGPGSITRHLIHQGCCDVVAIEIDPDAIDRLRTICQHVYSADLNDPHWQGCLGNETKFDVVIAADVLEHVTDPWRVLGQMRDLLTDTGFIVLSLPHIGHMAIAACLMEQDFAYRDWGLLDRTHLRFFGLKNIESLVDNAGLSIIDAGFVIKAPEATEFAEYWERLPVAARKALRANKFGYVYQVVTKSVPAIREMTPVRLMELPVQIPPLPKQDLRGWLRSQARDHLSPEIRRAVRQAARKIGLAV